MENTFFKKEKIMRVSHTPTEQLRIVQYQNDRTHTTTIERIQLDCCYGGGSGRDNVRLLGWLYYNPVSREGTASYCVIGDRTVHVCDCCNCWRHIDKMVWGPHFKRYLKSVFNDRDVQTGPAYDMDDWSREAVWAIVGELVASGGYDFIR